MLHRFFFLFLAAAAAAASALEPPRAPQINPLLLSRQWPARWIAPAGTEPFKYGVYHLRKTLQLPAVPAAFRVHVSGDNRYQFFVNGERVLWGPARGDLFHWKYETVDLAPHLRPGKNVLAALVWNYAQHAPEAQIWNQTGFILQGDGEAEQVANSGPGWVGIAGSAYSPLLYTSGQMRGYYVVGPGDRIDGARYPWGWNEIDFDDSAWKPAVQLTPGSPRDSVDGPNRWMLAPRDIPLMEESPQRLARVRQVSGITVPAGFPAAAADLVAPARSRVRLLLDQNVLTTAYPDVRVSGGRGASISLGYAEALYEPGGRRGDKGDRDQVEGKEFVGNRDIFIADGGPQRSFSPLWWRTYRYMDLQIETAEEPLTLHDLHGIYTGYPFAMRATWSSPRPELQKMLDVGWRTARLCAHETYMDCPYYEQLQYAGDTRLQCMVSLYNAGDPLLMRSAIRQLNDSRQSDGATMSRFPTRQQQYIPSFALWWIGMLHDYWRYVDDPEFVREMMPGTRAVLDFFARYQREDGSLEALPWWNYIDWAAEWPRGVPPPGADGSSAPIDILLLLAHDWAADLETAHGSRTRGAELRESAGRLRRTLRKKYWIGERGLFADDPEGKRFSQQSNSLAVIAGMTKGEEARAVVERTLVEQGLTRCSYFFQYYLHQAVRETGLGDRYLSLLGDWRRMLSLNLTTWAERIEGSTRASRSDCHAWSSHPNVELYRTLLGIDSAAPGFRRVRIAPHPGDLPEAAGSIPHPRGQVGVELKQNAGRLEVVVLLPPGVPGDLIWLGRSYPLKPGENRFELPAQ